MNGTNQSTVKVTLRNPLDFKDQLCYTINVLDNSLAQAWISALKEIIVNGNLLEKNFCFLGFPDTARDIDYLCQELMASVKTINNFFPDYQIEEIYTPQTIRIGLDPNQDLMNCLHNHFEKLQGTVWNLSDYYRKADYETKYAIRQLNNLCHELESLMLSLRKKATLPNWVRSSQITTFINATRYNLLDEHKKLFLSNGYNRMFGGVYMHWSQIGKTLFEVFRDEGAPNLDNTVCEAISELKYYSGEFDIEWGNSVYLGGEFPWHDQEQKEFKNWLVKNNLNPDDPDLCLGYLPIGQVDITKFGVGEDPVRIREILGRYLDIYKIEVDDIEGTYNYCWTDSNYKKIQIDKLRPGYDHSSRG